MCKFSISFSGSAETLINRAKSEITRAGGIFNGDANHGSLQVKTPIGTIAGEYEIAEGIIYILIAKKPFLLSCKRIEKELQQVLK